MTLGDRIGLTIQRMVVFIGIELLIIYNNYLTQRDLIKQVIKTHMTRKQQTMLRDFFNRTSDPVVILYGTFILFANDCAKRLFADSHCEEVESDKRIFKVFEESASLHNLEMSSVGESKMNLTDFVNDQSKLENLLVSPSLNS